MNTRTLLNLALVAIAILLALVVFYEPGIEPEQAPPPLTSMDPENIQSIRKVQKGRPDIQLERKEEGWFLTAPLQVQANQSKVETLLDIVKTPSRNRYAVNELDLSRVGLDPPQVYLYLDDLALAFGDTEPLNRRRYVLLEDTVHLISGSTSYTAVTSDTPSFIDPALLPGDKAITQLHLPKVKGTAGGPKVDPKQTITLRRNQDTWIAEGTGGEPSSEAIAKLVKAWQQYTAQRVEMKGDTATLVTLEVQREGTSPIHFELLATLPRLVLARPDLGIQYHLPPTAWNTLFQLPQD